MVKLFFLCRRRPELSHTRYTDLLLNGHVPIALRYHRTMQRYVVNIVAQTPPGWEELDSIGELSFASLDDFRERLYDSPTGQAIIEQDVAGFLGETYAYATTEHIQRAPAASAVLGAQSPGVKLVCPIVRRTQLSHAAFVEHWIGTHVQLALTHHPGLSKYVTNVVDERLSPKGPQLDGIAELHFATEEAYRAGMFDSPDGERVVREDIARFIGRTAAYIVAEYPQR